MLIHINIPEDKRGDDMMHDNNDQESDDHNMQISASWVYDKNFHDVHYHCQQRKLLYTSNHQGIPIPIQPNSSYS